jgi:hypothetical protein
MVSQGILVPFFYVRVVVPELLPCSTMVVRFAVNEVVVGSSPTGAVLAGWQSGLMRVFAKDVTPKNVHRFESCSSRKLLKTKDLRQGGPAPFVVTPYLSMT